MTVGVINTLRIYEKLCEKFGEPQAKVTVEVIERAFERIPRKPEGVFGYQRRI